MTLATFKNRVIAHAALMRSLHMPHTLEDVIFWDNEWYRKYAETLRGKYDA